MADDGEIGLPAVGKTAVGIAAIRALESERPDRLFDDPLAARFVAASGRSLSARIEAASADPGTRRYLDVIQRWAVVRTRFLDDFVVNACTQGCRQVVVLGAGLDARAFRLQLPDGVRFFELDLPEVLEFKQRVVDSGGTEARSERRAVPVDLRDDWPSVLTGAGFASDAPSAWVAEGLLVYLSDEENEELVTRVSSLSPTGSQLGLTVADPDRDDRHMTRPAHLEQLWQSDGIHDPAEWLGRHGWVVRVFDASERAVHYGRLAASEQSRSYARLVTAFRL